MPPAANFLQKKLGKTARCQTWSVTLNIFPLCPINSRIPGAMRRCSRFLGILLNLLIHLAHTV